MKTTRQLRINDELIVDNFAGGGGASYGIELALRRSVDIAINHDPEAVALHTANHPLTKHYTEDVFEVDPVEVTEGKPVGLAWFSPDCTHFSNAKGGKPVSRRRRALAWVVVKWAKLVKPRVIILENVWEFLTWGPLLDNGRPDPARKGQTFDLFVRTLRKLGYSKIEWRKLNAADYGANTTRWRLVLIARSDSQNITWPEASHGPTKPKPWGTAAEIIDWSVLGTSIFERPKPLADNTLRRIACGIERFVLNNPSPFIVTVNHQGGFRGQELTKPFKTVTASREGDYLISPVLVQNGWGERPGQNPRVLNIHKPLGVCPAGGVKHALACALLLKNYGGNCKPVNGSASMDKPLPTITTVDHNGIVTATLTREFGTGRGFDITRPAPVVMPDGAGGKTGLVQAFLLQYNGKSKAQEIGEPLNTVPTRDRFALVTIKKKEYILADVLYRLLMPRELFRAQGFDDSYIIDPIYKGKRLSKTAQTRMCGNSVPPPMAAAVVRANCPDLMEGQLETARRRG